MLVAAITLFVFSTLALALGLRGKRLDDHPLCGRCGFDLVGSLAGSDTCPECGSCVSTPGRRGLWRKPPVRTGNRRRRRGVVAAAAATMVLSGVGTGALIWADSSKSGWNSFKPTWWLMLDTRTGSTATVDAALKELKARHALGQLSSAQMTALVERGIEWQASTRTWLPTWGDLIEGEWRKDALSQKLRDSYARHAFTLTITPRAKVRRGDQVPAKVVLDSRVGSGGLFDFNLEIKRMALDEQSLLSELFQADGSLDAAGGSGPEMVLAPEHQSYSIPDGRPISDGPRDAAVSLEPGRHTLRTSYRASVCLRQRSGSFGWYSHMRIPTGLESSSGFGRPSAGTWLAEWDMTHEVELEVLPATAETVELVKDETLAASVKNSIQVSIRDEEAKPYQEAGRRVRLSMRGAPMDVAFDVIIRGPGREWYGDLVSRASGQSSTYTPDLDLGPADAVYEVILKPNPDLVRRTTDITRIWGLDVVYKDIPVTAEPKYRGAVVSPGGGGGGSTGAGTAPELRTLASLVLPDKDRFAPNNHAFRSIALHMPTAYVGDREGDLYIFQVTDADSGQKKSAVKVVKDVGDGNDLKVVGETLLCTRNGSIEVYSLKSPEEPEHLGTFGPPRRLSSDSLVIGRGHAFLLGRHSIVSYELSNPAQPVLIKATELQQTPWTGCVVDNHLYAAESGEDPAKTGVGVYNISKPDDIQRVGFMPTKTLAYAVHPLRDGRILASLDFGSLVLRGPGPHGSTVLMGLADPAHPNVLAEAPSSGGRASVVMTTQSQEYLVCDGAVLELQGNSLVRAFPLYTNGSTLDGAAYHGDASGVYAALALDGRAVVIKLIGPAGSPTPAAPDEPE